MVRSGQVTVNTTGGVTSGLAGGPAAEALLLSRKLGCGRLMFLKYLKWAVCQ